MPPYKVPLFVPALSLALPSPAHQPTRPGGVGAQVGTPAKAVRAIVAEMNVTRRMPGAETLLWSVVIVFIRDLSRGRRSAVQLPAHYSENNLLVNAFPKV
jgi:hypothetical protein